MEPMFKFTADKNKRNNINEQKDSPLQFSGSIDKNISLLTSILSGDDTVVYRNFDIKTKPSVKCCIVFIEELTSNKVLNDDVLRPLMRIREDVAKKELPDFMLKNIIHSYIIKKGTDIDELIGSILCGDSVLLIDGIKEALIIRSRGWQSRQVSEPVSENVVRGPREGFTESIKINMSLIRRRLKNPGLKFEFMTVGTKTQTEITICYLEGCANDKILSELRTRLNGIKIDGILESGYIEELIKDNPISPFKTIGNTERPDTVVGKLLEGRIAVICDGTPFVLTLPFIFLEHFQSSEDYYNSYIYGSFNRLIRILGFFLTTSIPALYVGLVAFHQEMIPTPLFFSIIAAREGVPFPTPLEALMMLFIFEVIREAGIRMPSAIGQAVSIVGALVLGEAAVTARVISAPIVIVIALAGINSLLLPKMLGPLVIMRVILLLLSSVLGVYGYIFGIIFFFIHLMSIESFGTPYMSNINSISKYEIQDSALRAPWWYTYYKPVFVSDKSRDPKKGGVNK